MAAGRVRTKSQRWWVAAVALAAFLGWEYTAQPISGRGSRPAAAGGANRYDARVARREPQRRRRIGNQPNGHSTDRQSCAIGRAPVAQQPAISGQSLQHGQVVLLGTTIADDGSFALVKDAAAARSRVLRKGDRVDGLLVTGIRPDRLELTDGATGELVILKVDDEARPGGYSAAPQAAGPVPVAVSQSNVMSAAASPPMAPEYAEPSPSEEDQPASSSH